MKTFTLSIPVGLVILIFAALLSAGPKGKSTANTSADATHQAERLFQVQCGRCHHAPEQIPPSIVGTALRHMRVRANLTPADERLLMKYLAP